MFSEKPWCRSGGFDFMNFVCFLREPFSDLRGRRILSARSRARRAERNFARAEVFEAPAEKTVLSSPQ